MTTRPDTMMDVTALRFFDARGGVTVVVMMNSPDFGKGDW
jgi:hypothetical protein